MTHFSKTGFRFVFTIILSALLTSALSTETEGTHYGSDMTPITDVKSVTCNGFLCDNGHHCIPYSWVCDGWYNCADGSDEGWPWCYNGNLRHKTLSNIETKEAAVSVMSALSAVGKKGNTNKSSFHSEDNIEEISLLDFSCPFWTSPWTKFHCLNGRCVDWQYRCNRKNDCGDNSDEYICIHLKMSAEPNPARI